MRRADSHKPSQRRCGASFVPQYFSVGLPVRGPRQIQHPFTGSSNEAEQVVRTFSTTDGDGDDAESVSITPLLAPRWSRPMVPSLGSLIAEKRSEQMQHHRRRWRRSGQFQQHAALSKADSFSARRSVSHRCQTLSRASTVSVMSTHHWLHGRLCTGTDCSVRPNLIVIQMMSKHCRGLLQRGMAAHYACLLS